MAKTGLDRYANKQEEIRKRAEYTKMKYKRYTFLLDKEKDSDLIEYISSFDNNSTMIRTLYEAYKKTTE